MQRSFSIPPGVRRAIAATCVTLAILGCDSPVAPEPNTPVGLRVWAEVAPTVVSVHDTAATILIRIHVENPALDTLRIVSGGPPYVFTEDPARSHGLEESVRIASGTDSLNAGPNIDYWGKPLYTFPPHDHEYTETVVTLRDWVAGGWALVPGAYRVRSYFNGHEGTSASFALVP